MAKLTVASLKKKADAAFSLYIRYRDAEFKRGEWFCVCITCGVEKPLKQMQNGHFVSRKVSLLRYDEENCNAQCSGCNVFKYGEQYAYSKALDDKYGDGTADKLWNQRFTTHKFTIPELEEIIHDSKEQIKWYEQERNGTSKNGHEVQKPGGSPTLSEILRSETSLRQEELS